MTSGSPETKEPRWSRLAPFGCRHAASADQGRTRVGALEAWTPDGHARLLAAAIKFTGRREHSGKDRACGALAAAVSSPGAGQRGGQKGRPALPQGVSSTAACRTAKAFLVRLKAERKLWVKTLFPVGSSPHPGDSGARRSRLRAGSHTAMSECRSFQEVQRCCLGCWRINLHWGAPLHPTAWRGKSLAPGLVEEKRSVLERQPRGRWHVPEAGAEKAALTVEMGPGHRVMGTQGPQPSSEGVLSGAEAVRICPHRHVSRTGSLACRAHACPLGQKASLRPHVAKRPVPGPNSLVTNRLLAWSPQPGCHSP